MLRCEHCEKETSEGEFVRCHDCGMHWLCPKCKKWNYSEPSYWKKRCNMMETRNRDLEREIIRLKGLLGRQSC